MRLFFVFSLCLVCLACSEDDAQTGTSAPSLTLVAPSPAPSTPEPSLSPAPTPAAPAATPEPTVITSPAPPEPVETPSEPETPTPLRPIGLLDVGAGAHVKLFTTLPGSQGKPKTTVRIATGRVEVFEIYDWAEHHEELRGQSGHRWYRVDPEASHWIYGLEQFAFTAAE